MADYEFERNKVKAAALMVKTIRRMLVSRKGKARAIHRNESIVVLVRSG